MNKWSYSDPEELASSEKNLMGPAWDLCPLRWSWSAALPSVVKWYYLCVNGYLQMSCRTSLWKTFTLVMTMCQLLWGCQDPMVGAGRGRPGHPLNYLRGSRLTASFVLKHPSNLYFTFCFSISLNDFLCIVADISTVSMRWTIEVQPNVEYKCRLYSS